MRRRRRSAIVDDDRRLRGARLRLYAAAARVHAQVMVEEAASLPGATAATRIVGTATIAARNLEVFRLGPREIDGSSEGTFNTGTGTALTRHAYRVKSNVPIVAYQFNPLENV